MNVNKMANIMFRIFAQMQSGVANSHKSYRRLAHNHICQSKSPHRLVYFCET